MCIKDFVYRFSHDRHFDIDHISIAHFRSLSGDSVDLLSRTICTTVLLVMGVSRTSLMVGRFRSKALLVLSEQKTDPSAVHCGSDQLLCCLIIGIHASGISIPLSLLMLSG